MKQLHRKIDTKKRAINDSKNAIRNDFETIKRKLGLKSGLSLPALGGIAIGFLLFPRKKMLLRMLFKTFTVVTTARQLLDLLPGGDHHTAKPRVPRKTTTKAMR